MIAPIGFSSHEHIRHHIGVRAGHVRAHHLAFSILLLPGQAIGEAAGIVLKSIDTCAPKAPNFGVPDKNVFK
jgi:hypothetical protein